MEPRILVVEDDPEIAALVSLHLRNASYEVDTVRDGAAALERAERNGYDLVVLDLMLPPGPDGLEVCRRLRARSATMPILMLTARAEEIDRVLGLELGADDYVTKPFSVREVVARVKALLRRVAALGADRDGPAEEAIEVGTLRLDPARRLVQVSGESVELTPREFDLLLHFARHPGRVFTRASLLDQVWGYGHEGYGHTVNSHINRLRGKIERDPAKPEYILTVWGVGYKFRELGARDPG